jgi:hypothetical protein
LWGKLYIEALGCIIGKDKIDSLIEGIGALKLNVGWISCRKKYLLRIDKKL